MDVLTAIGQSLPSGGIKCRVVCAADGLGETLRRRIQNLWTI